ncbi:MAG: polysaccharide biosynthesis/export family protein [Cyclobacteriaceae bacterium]|nr:polysaccharide biosynthesis/export family protein [Cyclobacteriaceae bacterium]MCH8517874.1 polysaccharide biosynthesis/export family protein [Cyclobacteriaceae bacterium]
MMHHRREHLLQLLIFLGLFPLFFSSCVSNKRYDLLQDKADMEGFYELYREPYCVQINDILYITIKSQESSLLIGQDDLGMNLFNMMDVGGNSMRMLGQQGGGGLGNPILYLTGYSVDFSGNIEIPTLGTFFVEGKTVEEIRDEIKSRSLEYFTDATVVVKMTGINFTVTGEVRVPGSHKAFKNQLNVIQALSAAGGMIITAKRQEVDIFRQYPDGHVEVHTIDLTDDRVLESPYFWVQPNDIIHVRPVRARELGIGTEGFRTFTGVLSLVSSTLVLIALLTQNR